MHQERARYLLTSSNTFQGYATFIPELLKGLSKLYIVQGSPGTGKATLIRGSGMKLLEKGYEVEFWLSALDPSSFDGWHLPLQRVAMVNGSLPIFDEDIHVPGIQTIDLDVFLTGPHDRRAEEVQQLQLRVDQQKARAAEYFQQAAARQEQMEQHGQSFLQQDRLTELCRGLLLEINRQRVMEQHYFATVLTPEGMINYYDEISRNCKRRYVLTGPRAAERLVLKELAQEMKKRGLALEYYHSGMDKDQLMMLMLPELRLAVTAALNTAVRRRPGDVVVSLNELFPPEAVAAEPRIVQEERAFQAQIMQAVQGLGEWIATQQEIEHIYTSQMDFTGIDQLQASLWDEIVK
jgi:hypothetical protein